VAFFAHIGGFVFGVLVARLLLSSGRLGLRAGEPATVGAAP
jgi:membrane associated rhomboid family serine protease